MVSPRSNPNEEAVIVSQTTDGANIGASVSNSGPVLTPGSLETTLPFTPTVTSSMQQPYGMPHEYVSGVHHGNSTTGGMPGSGDTFPVSFQPYQSLGPTTSLYSRPPGFGSVAPSIPTFTSSSAAVLRQQMDESNHEMVHMLTQKIGAVLRPLIQNSTQSYQQLATQMTRIGDFLGAPRAQFRHNFPPENQVPQREIYDEMNMQQAPVVEEQPRLAQRPHVVMVHRDQDPDNVVRQVRQQANAGEDNLENIVERIMVRNGANPGLRRPNFSSPLADYVLQEELPRGWKVPKFTKFAGDTEESTVEHVARYQTEAGDLANNEELKMKFFPSSLTKNVFLWFTTLAPQSIHTWIQLERLFHEQFYMGQTKISLKELASVKRKTSESVDQYLNRFRLLKARCFTQVPEHELVEMAAGGLDYSIRKKLDTQYL